MSFKSLFLPTVHHLEKIPIKEQKEDWESFLTEVRKIYEKYLNRGEGLTLREFLEKIQASYHDNVLTISYQKALVSWWEHLHQMKYLEPLLAEEGVSEILFHGTQLIQVDRQGTLQSGPPFPLCKEDYQLTLEILSFKNQVNWNYSHPYASFHLNLQNQRMRATLIHFSMTPDKESKLFLRKFPSRPFPLQAFLQHSQENLGHFLQQAVRDKKNILICGATSSGKTALLNTLLHVFIPEQEHVVILEDTHEIFSPLSSRTFLLAKSQSLLDLCSYSLRLRPDRILLGEIRGEEVVPFFLTMNTGHQGLMGTIHANSAYDALNRVSLLMGLYSPNRELSFSLSMDLICHNMDYVFFMENKKIKEVIRVLSSENGKAYIEEIFPG